MRLLLLVLVLPFLLTGCASVDNTPYPSSWPSLQQHGTTCSAINGSYESAAIRTSHPDRWQQVRLALTVLPQSVDYSSIRIISLALNDAGDRLRVTGSDADGHVVAKYDYARSSGIFRCDGGQLVIRTDRLPDAQKAPDNPVVGFTQHDVRLLKARDGSLIMKESGSVTGMAFMVVPVHAEGTQWWQFRAVRPGPDQ